MRRWILRRGLSAQTTLQSSCIEARQRSDEAGIVGIGDTERDRLGLRWGACSASGVVAEARAHLHRTRASHT
jgi:hypothetical protein